MLRHPRLRLSRLFLVSSLAVSAAVAERPSRRSRLDEAVSTAIAGDYPRALELFRAQLQTDQERPLWNYYVGVTYMQMGQPARALPYLQLSIPKDDAEGFPQAYYWLCRAYFDQDKPAGATAILERGLKRFPSNRDLLSLRSRPAPE